ncbi:MAG: HIT domain-containing protein [Rhizobiaceae bacterium]
MAPDTETEFVLHRQLAWDSEHVLWLELCELRLMNDSRWPWLLLIPQRTGVTEIHDLDPLDQSMLAIETGMAANMLQSMTGCDKINSGALGNVVSQLHVHVVARNEHDPNWPGPVWGHGEKIPYSPAELANMIETLRAAFDATVDQIKDDE